MIPHKTSRGQLAMARLGVSNLIVVDIYVTLYRQTFEGIPEPYDKKKRVVVPEAIKVIRLRSDRNFCVLGNLSREFGWNYGPLVEKLEAQRKAKEQAYYAEKKAKAALKAKAEAAADLSAVAPVLSALGH